MENQINGNGELGRERREEDGRGELEGGGTWHHHIAILEKEAAVLHAKRCNVKPYSTSMKIRVKLNIKEAQLGLEFATV